MKEKWCLSVMECVEMSVSILKQKQNNADCCTTIREKLQFQIILETIIMIIIILQWWPDKGRILRCGVNIIWALNVCQRKLPHFLPFYPKICFTENMPVQIFHDLELKCTKTGPQFCRFRLFTSSNLQSNIKLKQTILTTYAFVFFKLFDTSHCVLLLSLWSS